MRNFKKLFKQHKITASLISALLISTYASLANGIEIDKYELCSEAKLVTSDFQNVNGRYIEVSFTIPGSAMSLGLHINKPFMVVKDTLIALSDRSKTVSSHIGNTPFVPNDKILHAIIAEPKLINAIISEGSYYLTYYAFHKTNKGVPTQCFSSKFSIASFSAPAPSTTVNVPVNGSAVRALIGNNPILFWKLRKPVTLPTTPSIEIVDPQSVVNNPLYTGGNSGTNPLYEK